MSRRSGLVAGGVVAALAGFVVFALTPEPIPETPRAWFDPGQVRWLAHAPGSLPSHIDVALTAMGHNPRCLAVAGFACEDIDFAGWVYRVVGPTGSVVIEAPADEATLDAGLPNGAEVDESAFALSQRWLAEADHVVFTHEHFDHAAGLAIHPDFSQIAPRAFVTRAQAESPDFAEAGFSDEQAAELDLVDLARPRRIAPGVVAIPAGGHTKGSIWIYVALRTGAELLFVGDTAWSAENIAIPRGTARAVSWGLGADGAAVADQLAFLHALQRDRSDLQIVVAHDQPTHLRLASQGVFRRVETDGID